MKLFDSLVRNDKSGPRQYRSEFEFLNQTSLLRPTRIRALLEKAYARYSGDKNELRGRFRSADNAAHTAASFELILHELMISLRLRPSAPRIGSGAPDFRIVLPNGGSAIIEARMTQPYSNSHYLQAIDAIDSVKRPHVRLDVLARKEPVRNFSKAQLRRRVAAFVEQLDASSLPTALKPEGPHLQVDDGDGRMKIYAIRQKNWTGGVGVRSDFDIADEDALRRALAKKKSKYPSISEPYILAICAATGYSTEQHFVDALFRESRGSGPDDLRGLWAKGRGSKVSAVLACQNFKPSSISGARLQLLVNPNATHSLGANPFGCDQLMFDGQRIAGASLRELLKLPPHWPSRTPKK